MAELLASRDDRAAANRAYHRAVSELVTSTHGEDGFEERPWFCGSSSTGRFPTPEAALRAAVLLRDMATDNVVLQIRESRGRGASWERVAELLGISGEDSDGNSPAGRAFFIAAPEETYSFRPSTTTWTCSTCSQYVTDRGPFEDDEPKYMESGHDPACTRQAAAIAAWRQRIGDE